ncbi:hypothetical protein EST38_g1249 [Candolleomyces aberdarensis]|uniref:Uncharacterized protein n=1 Tax=Candolleomyces aberdarensis TaxID=2316362 RepID=A0A4Q2DWI8_9AGAR|nr:hypothetical protein EST38_g1249 [Candolleomyces aberdarensis]
MHGVFPEGTSAVISGSQALNFMSRLPPDPTSDLDIFMDFDSLSQIGEYLITADYHFKRRNRYNDPYKKFDAKVEEICEDEDKIEAYSHGKRILDVIDFHKTRYEGEDVVTKLKIQLIVLAVDPTRFILSRFHSTAVMNIITPHKAVSLFPMATFHRRNSYVANMIGTAEGVAAWKAKYTTRGFKVIEGFSEPFPTDFSAQDSIL